MAGRTAHKTGLTQKSSAVCGIEVYEEALKAQANRLVTISEVKDDELSLITIDDIITALSKVSSNIKQSGCDSRNNL